ncbi:MAG TPA: hypothetical protein VIT68_04710 [Candidatus Gracilibacteria bacterium]
MRNSYLIIATITFIIGVIIAFENIILQAQGIRILFAVMTTSLFFPLIIIFALGMVSGFFFGLAKGTKAKGYNGDMDI